MTLADAMSQAKAQGVARLDAQQLLAHLLQQSRSWVIAHATEALPEAVIKPWGALLVRRAEGEPLAYLLGNKEFYGLNLGVSPDVLVPRPDTETLVDWGLDCLQSGPQAPRVLDLGTGSGAIALAIQHAFPQAGVWATDASAAALAVAQDNALRLNLPVQFVLSDWWLALGGLRFDVIVSNPPYIAEGDPHLPALRHEPRQALSSGADGLDALRHLIEHAPLHLVDGGWLLLEHGYNQAGAVSHSLKTRGFLAIETRADAAGVARCTGGRWGNVAALK